MEQLRIDAKNRERKAKGDNRRLRRTGLVPAVIYGGPSAPQSVSVDDHQVEMILRGARHSNAVFNLAIEGGQTETTIIRDIQRHPVNAKMVHIDFQRVDLENEVEVSVQVHAVGSNPKGVKAGGILEHVTRSVDVRCKPMNMPKRLDADLTDLDMNQTFHVSDLVLPEGVEVLNEAETPLYVILPPKGEAEAGEGAAEPELIGGKKVEETK